MARSSFPRARHEEQPIPPRTCSDCQKRFWLINQLYPGTPSLHVAARWSLHGAVKTAHLEQAFRLVLSRHEVLRSRFVDTGSELVQIAEPQVPFHIPEIDLSRMPPEEAHAEAGRIAQVEAHTSFDLSSPPFVRATRVVLGVQTSILLVTAHHIVMDGWSLGVLARELGELCAALESAKPARLPPLSLSYADYCERQALQGLDGFGIEEKFWTAKLQGMGHFELPVDHPRPPVRNANGRILSLTLARPLTLALGELARSEGCTLFIAASAVLLTLLHRYTGETDIGIGTQTPGRDDEELEALIGPTVNTLVLRNDLGGDPVFKDLLGRVRDTVTDAFDHQRLPIERVIDILRPARDLSRPPLFSINFALHRPHVKNATYGRLRIVELPPLSSGPLYDLSFFMIERADGWQLSCEFDTDLFDDDTVIRLLHGYQAILRGAVKDPTCRLSRLPVMGAAERATLMSESTGMSLAFPRERTIIDLFREQAQTHPAATALISGSAELTYAELEARSNRLAHYLRKLGVARGHTVGLFLSRSADLVVGLLAVLKAGAAYVPIDPAHPVDRIRYVAANSRLAALLSTGKLHERLGAMTVPTVLLDGEAADIAGQPEQAPADGPKAADLAYVIYTSGSTGKPKGVQIGHRSLMNLLWYSRQRPGITAQDCFLALSTIAFDIATFELLLPLSVGARLVLAGDEQAGNGDAIAQLIERHQVSIVFAAPVTWQVLLLAGWQGRPGLKMLCGGEAMPRQLAESLLRCGGELWNLYGPTETTILSSALKVESGSGPVLLGPPIANTSFHVLDQHGEPVLPGAPGELYIGGEGLAIGYLDLPDLTSGRFLHMHGGGEAPRRLYRTGDIVRTRSGGTLEYLGRADGQIKLRGFRIELGEIETVLLNQPEVAEALTVVLGDATGGSLVAYVVPAAGHAQGAQLVAVLKSRLALFLPKYMCPSTYVILEGMPRMPNGKVDRRALPPPLAAQPQVTTALSAAEEKVAAIWRGLLEGADIGPESNFFELGGHSLLAAHMLARIEQQFGQRLTLSVLFQEPTVRGLTRMLTQEDAREYNFRQVIKLQSNGTRAPLIAINNTGIYGVLAKKFGSERPFVSLQLFDPAQKGQAMPGSLEEIAQGYVELIRRVQPEGPYALVGWCVAGTLAFEVARQLDAGGAAVDQLFMIDTEVPRYFERMGPLRRMLGRHSHRLQLIARDWRRMRRNAGSLSGAIGNFLGRRQKVRQLLRWLGKLPAKEQEAPAATVAEEHYDQWLLHFLHDAVEAYEPGPYAGRVVLFRSAEEPKGRFLDDKLGWLAFTPGGLDVIEIAGDHFSVFRDPGAEDMAQHMCRYLNESTSPINKVP